MHSKMTATKLIALTGGIGAGKSVVARALRVMGYPVYDCDSRAKQLMNTDAAVVQAITERFGRESYTAAGELDRKRLASIIFSDDAARLDVNAIVHPAVTRDLLQWAQAASTSLAFVETALIAESGLQRVVHAVWNVEAPTAVRIARVVARNGLTPQQVQQRIDAQQALRPAGAQVIVNDDHEPLLPQLLNLLEQQQSSNN